MKTIQVGSETYVNPRIVVKVKRAEGGSVIHTNICLADAKENSKIHTDWPAAKVRKALGIK